MLAHHFQDKHLIFPGVPTGVVKSPRHDESHRIPFCNQISDIGKRVTPGRGLCLQVLTTKKPKGGGAKPRAAAPAAGGVGAASGHASLPITWVSGVEAESERAEMLLKFPSNKAGVVIGAKGATIKGLMKRLSVRPSPPAAPHTHTHACTHTHTHMHMHAHAMVLFWPWP